MKSTLLLIIGILFSLNTSGQIIPLHPSQFKKQERKFEKRNTPLGLDFQLFGLSLHKAKKKGLIRYVGWEFGILPERFLWFIMADADYTQPNTLISENRMEEEFQIASPLISIHYFNRIRLQNKALEIDFGGRYAIFFYSRHSSYNEEQFGLPTYLGLYVKPTIGLKWGKVGFRLDNGFIRKVNTTFDWE